MRICPTLHCSGFPKPTKYFLQINPEKRQKSVRTLERYKLLGKIDILSACCHVHIIEPDCSLRLAGREIVDHFELSAEMLITLVEIKFLEMSLRACESF